MSAAGVPASGAQRWWRSHSVRVRLTIWYLGAMVVVLAVYVGAVYVFVSRNASQALESAAAPGLFAGCTRICT